MRATLEGVKPGDTIAVRTRWGVEFFVVERLTKTQAVCGKASFRIDSGVQVGTRSAGSGWHSTTRWGRLVTPEEVARIKAEKAFEDRIRSAVLAVDKIKITAENLEAAEAFIAASQKKEPENAA